MITPVKSLYTNCPYRYQFGTYFDKGEERVVPYYWQETKYSNLSEKTQGQVVKRSKYSTVRHFYLTVTGMGRETDRKRESEKETDSG